MTYHLGELNHAQEQALDNQLAHPTRSLNILDNSIYKQRMLKLWVDTYMASLDLHVQIPFFTGPFDSAARADVGIQATAQGKARLAMRAIRDTKTIPANTRIDDICHEILVHWAGEQPGCVHLPRIPERHAGAIHTTLNSRPLKILRSVLQTIAYDDYWDGDGQWYTRPFPTTSEAEFTGGQDGTILGRIVRNETDQDFWNVVDGHGWHGLYAKAEADPDSPLSAQSLKRTNTAGDIVLGWVPFIGQYPNTHHQDRLQAIVDSQLAKGLSNAFNYQFTARPWWRADERDCVTINWRGTVAVINLPTFGFSDANVMTVGFHRVMSLAGPRARFR
jgi:hypothetical protein